MQSRLMIVYRKEDKKSSNFFEERMKPVNRIAVDLKR
jgi:hypothetical protein